MNPSDATKPRSADTFELLVFDWDGTLMDSEARIVTCMRAGFEALGLPPPSPPAVRNVIGLGLDQAIATLFPLADGPMRQSIIAVYREWFLGTDVTPTPMFDGAVAMIERLHARDRLLAVATGKSRPGLNRALAESGLKPYFHATRCADDSFSKPHPAMLLELMDELGVAPAATVMIGDTEYDLEMARNAGVASIGVGYGAHSPERLFTHQPLGCAMSVAELAAWLAGDAPLPGTA